MSLGMMKETAEAYLGDKLIHAVVTVPRTPPQHCAFYDANDEIDAYRPTSRS
ncbi:hypothetical protein FRC00_004120 [Tulasnella sp. 408]|nr:hypothetical protein FRC00_004120 [Tulasnella sp. 408]